MYVALWNVRWLGQLSIACAVASWSASCFCRRSLLLCLQHTCLVGLFLAGLFQRSISILLSRYIRAKARGVRFDFAWRFFEMRWQAKHLSVDAIRRLYEVFRPEYRKASSNVRSMGGQLNNNDQQKSVRTSKRTQYFLYKESEEVSNSSKGTWRFNVCWFEFCGLALNINTSNCF